VLVIRQGRISHTLENDDINVDIILETMAA
jgi:hypothetical protein